MELEKIHEIMPEAIESIRNQFEHICVQHDITLDEDKSYLILQVISSACASYLADMSNETIKEFMKLLLQMVDFIRKERIRKSNPSN